MKPKSGTIAATAALVVLVAVWGGHARSALGAPAVKRSVLLKQDMAIPGREAVMVSEELPAGSAEGRHTHPAEVFAFVEEGSVSLEREGSPTVVLGTGEIFHVAPGQIHEARNYGNAPARLSVVFVAEKDKPLTTQVP